MITIVKQDRATALVIHKDSLIFKEEELHCYMFNIFYEKVRLDRGLAYNVSSIYVQDKCSTFHHKYLETDRHFSLMSLQICPNKQTYIEKFIGYLEELEMSEPTPSEVDQLITLLLLESSLLNQ